jgi:hypothetical protein
MVEVGHGGMRVIVFGPRPLARMDKPDRIRAIYLHACLQYANQEPMNNASVRRRFGLGDQDNVAASRFIREALNAGEVVPFDPAVGPRAMRYLPYWAGQSEEEG